MPLAFVFWHRRNPALISQQSYEEKLVRFQETLQTDSPPAGFIGSMVARIQGAPWMESSAEAYEDWYIVDGSAVLDELNTAAVSGARKEPHDYAARSAIDTRGGLYRVVRGSLASVATAKGEVWFSKPAGMTYERFDGWARDSLDIEEGTSLWRRQMVLGPTPEFCFLSTENPRTDGPTTAVVSEQFKPIRTRREAIWSGHGLLSKDDGRR